METPYNVSHLAPAKTENLRYLEFIKAGGALQRKLGIQSVSIPSDILAQLREIEAEIQQRFNVGIDVIARAQEAIHIRNTTLPLYERLLNRIRPEVVVIVVSYGKETLIEACKRNGIPVVELQHGVIYDFHFGYSYPEGETKTTFPDYLLTFGEFWNETARYPIPDKQVISVGYPYLETRLKTYENVENVPQLLFISQGTIGEQLSKFALAVHESDEVNHEVVYKLHPGEYDRWENEYPWLAKSDVRVIEESTPPLYRLFAESSAQIGVGSTAIYEGLCFDLQTFVFDTDGADVLRPLVDSETAVVVETVDELAMSLKSTHKPEFDRGRFFKQDAVENVISELKKIRRDQ
jgi:rRNA-processing protein FCF1